MLKVENFSLHLRGSDRRILPVLENVSISLPRGKCLGIAGESGSGKSVFAMSIAGLFPSASVHAYDGKIEFSGLNVLTASEEELRQIRGKKIGFIFQEPMTAMNPLMTLFEQIAETVTAHEKSVTRSDLKLRVLAALNRAGFADPEKFMHSFPHQLSGGMRQRAMIAMAMVMEPEMIIADEPTTAIDAGLQVQLLAELRAQIDDAGRTMIFISHDLGVIRAVSDYLAIFYAGCLVETGKTEDVLNKPSHPYTADLIAALPRLVSARKLPVPIGGNLPAPDKKPHGCVYSDRCKLAQEKCRAERPVLATVAGEHAVCCFFPLWGEPTDG